MMANGLLQIALYLGVLVLLVKPLGLYMARVFSGERTFLDPVLRPVERLIYRFCGVDPRQEQHWTTYTAAMLLFNVVGLVILYALQRLQHVLPLNPQNFDPPAAHSAFNTAASFTSNTNWQSYAGESTMSYLSQMAGLTVQNFVSAATGIALAVALIRAFTRHAKQTLGNFWVDLVRTTLWVLLPLSLVLALLLAWQGVPQEGNADFVWAMENVLEVYTRPHVAQRPVVCLDEASMPLVADATPPLPMQPGPPVRQDDEYERCGTATLFMLFDPPAGQR